MKTSFDKNGKFKFDWFVSNINSNNPTIYRSTQNFQDDIEIASVHCYYEGKQEAQDSARLIAAAPRLFNALVGLMESTGTLVADPYECDLTDEERAALAECRAAIAAARGENENF